MKKLIYSQEDLDLILSLEIEEKDREIERLNNIIDELEKWLDEEYEYLDKYGYPAGLGYAMGQIKRTKNKLKELKGEEQ